MAQARTPWLTAGNGHDDDLVAALAIELHRKTARLEISIGPVSAFQLAALLQLALRHPEVDGANRETVHRFLDAVRIYFADEPTVLEALRRGEDPASDVLGTDREGA